VINVIQEIFSPRGGAEGWKFQTRVAYVSYVVFVIVGLSIPDNILRDYSWTRSFTDFMAAIVPQIDRITALNIAADVNRFNYSLLWAVSPLYFLIVYRGINANIASGPYSYNSLSVGRLVFVSLGLIWLVGFCMFLWTGVGFVTGKEPLAVRLFGGLFLRALWAPFMVVGFIVAVAGGLSVCKALLSRRVSIHW